MKLIKYLIALVTFALLAACGGGGGNPGSPSGGSAVTPMFTTAPSALTLANGTTSASYNVNGGASPYTANSDMPSLISVSLNDSTFTISAMAGASGSGTVTIVDAKGTKVTIAVTVPTLPGPSALFSTAPSNLTLAGGTSSGPYAVTGGTAPYTATSNNPGLVNASIPTGSNLLTIGAVSGVTGGSASVIISDAHGAQLTISVTVPAPSALFSTAPATLQILNGTTNFYTVFGGSAPYVVNTNGVNARAVLSGGSLAITGLVPGNQTVAISDARGAVITIDVTVKAGLYTDAPTNLSLAASTGASYAIYGGIPYSGAALYRVNSSNPAIASATVTVSTLSISGLAAGSTALVITDSVGATVTINVTVPAAGALMSTAPSSLRLATGTSGSYAISGGTGPYTATSANPAIVSASTSGSTLLIGAVANTVGGNANVIVTDAVGTAPLTISVTAAPVQFFTTAPSTLSIAAGASKVFAVFGGTLPYSVVNTYPDIAAGVIPSLDSTTLTITGKIAGSGSVIVSDAKGVSVTIAVVVNAAGPMSLSAPSSVFIARNTSNTYDIIGGIPPFLATSSNLSVIQASIINGNQVKVVAVGGGSATFAVTDSAGTQVSVSVSTETVVTPPTPVAFYVSAPAALNMGAGTHATYQVGGGTSPYSASSSDSRVATVSVSYGSITITGVSLGTATLQISDAVGGSKTISVKVDNGGAVPTPFFVAAPSALTMGATTTANYAVGGGTLPYSVSSSDNRVATVSVSLGSITITGVSLGTATLQISDAVGGSKTISVKVDNGGAVPTPFFVAAPSALTMGATTTANYAVGGGTLPYSVSSSDNRVATASVTSAGVLTINALAVGTANLLIGDALGASKTIAVTVDNSGGTGPTAAFSIDILASGNSLNSTPGSSISFIVTVKDSVNATLPDQTVTFAASSGTLTGANPAPVTNAAGTISTVSLSPGADASIRNITVTAKTGTVIKTITIPVVGTTLAVSGPGAALVGSAPQNFTVKAVDSAGKPIVGASLTVASALLNGISPSTVTTDSSGAATFAFTAAIVGTDTLTATGLGTSGMASVVVSNVDFGFIAPAAGALLPVSTANTVTVLYRVAGLGVGGQTVTFGATRGTLSATTAGTSSAPATLGQATVTVSSTTAGPVTVSAQLGTARTSLTATFVATVPNNIVLQVNPAAVLPNASGNTNQSALTAVVRDAVGNPVQGVVVNFAAVTDGSNGSIAPGSATTDVNGLATAQFISGPLSTAANGVQIKATVQSIPAINSTAFLTVNGEALFISIAQSSTLTVFDSTTYQKDFSVYVTDANGAPAANRAVTLSVDPISYGKGELTYTLPSGPWKLDSRAIDSASSLACLNEDRNRNGILDAGDVDLNGDGRLQPGLPVVITSSVVTDALGFGAFTLRYGKNYAWWVYTQITAKSLVGGTESKQMQFYDLAMSAADANSPGSPANQSSPFGIGAGTYPAAINCADPL